MQPLQQIAWHLPENLDFQDLQLSLADKFDYKRETEIKRSAAGMIPLTGGFSDQILY